MNKPLINPSTFIPLDGSVRYGVSRNCDATDAHGKPVKLALAVIERDNGSFETVAIREDKIRFFGEGIIEEAVRKAAGL